MNIILHLQSPWIKPWLLSEVRLRADCIVTWRERLQEHGISSKAVRYRWSWKDYLIIRQNTGSIGLIMLFST